MMDIHCWLAMHCSGGAEVNVVLMDVGLVVSGSLSHGGRPWGQLQPRSGGNLAQMWLLSREAFHAADHPGGKNTHREKQTHAHTEKGTHTHKENTFARRHISTENTHSQMASAWFTSASVCPAAVYRFTKPPPTPHTHTHSPVWDEPECWKDMSLKHLSFRGEKKTHSLTHICPLTRPNTHTHTINVSTPFHCFHRGVFKYVSVLGWFGVNETLQLQRLVMYAWFWIFC